MSRIRRANKTFQRKNTGPNKLMLGQLTGHVLKPDAYEYPYPGNGMARVPLFVNFTDRLPAPQTIKPNGFDVERPLLIHKNDLEILLLFWYKDSGRETWIFERTDKQTKQKQRSYVYISKEFALYAYKLNKILWE